MIISINIGAANGNSFAIATMIKDELAEFHCDFNDYDFGFRDSKLSGFRPIKHYEIPKNFDWDKCELVLRLKLHLQPGSGKSKNKNSNKSKTKNSNKSKNNNGSKIITALKSSSSEMNGVVRQWRDLIKAQFQNDMNIRRKLKDGILTSVATQCVKFLITCLFVIWLSCICVVGATIGFKYASGSSRRSMEVG